MLSNPLIFAFSLTFLAGISTGIGSLLCLLYKKFNPKFLGIMLGISAGVMLYVSFVEILTKAKLSLSAVFGEKLGYTYTLLGFFIGILIIILIDKILPHHHEEKVAETNDQKLLRLGMFSALALSIHNFPEGLATFLSALENPTYGISIAAAIAIHNIPEGIAVAIPIYYATKNRKKAFLYSFLSGLTEPIGALIGYFVLLQFFDESIFGAIFASVAGMMVYISINELIPTAKEYAGKKLSTYGIVLGMFVMAVSLVLFM